MSDCNIREFNVGDSVVCIRPVNSYIQPGLTGVICQNKDKSWTGTFWGICWDEFVDGHSCGGTCPVGYGFRVPEEYIKHDTEHTYEQCFSDVDINTLLFGGTDGK